MELNMATLYLTEQQTLVKKEGDTLVVHIPENKETGQEKRKVRVPLIKIDRVVVQGNSTLTSPAFITGKLHNMRTMLMRANRKRQNEAITTAVAALQQTIQQTNQAAPDTTMPDPSLTPPRKPPYQPHKKEKKKVRWFPA